jgi:hypothetical protein
MLFSAQSASTAWEVSLGSELADAILTLAPALGALLLHEGLPGRKVGALKPNTNSRQQLDRWGPDAAIAAGSLFVRCAVPLCQSHIPRDFARVLKRYDYL